MKGVSSMKVLIADDHRQITEVLREYVNKEGWEAIPAYDGAQALEIFRREKPDIALLDVMMPIRDGFSVCREIRVESQTPIIMITARGEDFERIMGLELGADDYIVKPFSPGEVIARIKAVMRRIVRSDTEAQVLEFEDLYVNLDEYAVRIAAKPIALTKKEIEILYTLATSRNKVFSRDNLLNSVWGYDYFGDSRTVDSHIKRLRAKLDQFSHPAWNLRTIWGVGYKFEVTDDEKK